MKKKILLTVSITLVAAVLCAFAVVPSSTLRTEIGNKVTISYPTSAQLKEGKLEICADYYAYGADFEVVQDITVATDREFSNKLELSDVDVDNTKYTYIFDAPEAVDKVYVAPPIVMIPDTIDRVDIALHEANCLTANRSEPALFAVEDVRMTTQQISLSERTNNSLEAIRVEVRGNGGEIIPRLPMLKVGDTEYGGIHTIIYDENNNFESGVFVFVLPQGVSAANIINNPNTVISVSEVLVKSTIKKAAFNNGGVTALSVSQ